MYSYKTYVCGICGSESQNKEDIIKCESKGVPLALVSIGDKIIFKDCEETPVAIEKMKNCKDGRRCLDEYNLARWTTCSCLCREELELEVLEVVINGHNISYVLGKDNEPINVWVNRYGGMSVYPTIQGNTLMQNIIDKYN